MAPTLFVLPHDNRGGGSRDLGFFVLGCRPGSPRARNVAACSSRNCCTNNCSLYPRTPPQASASPPQPWPPFHVRSSSAPTTPSGGCRAGDGGTRGGGPRFSPSARARERARLARAQRCESSARKRARAPGCLHVDAMPPGHFVMDQSRHGSPVHWDRLPRPPSPDTFAHAEVKRGGVSAEDREEDLEAGPGDTEDRARQLVKLLVGPIRT